MRPLIWVLGIATAIGQSASTPAQQPLKTAATGVVIDVSVLDQKGQHVLDLRPDDFELTDDGARQQIASVTLVHGGVLRAVSGTAPAVRPATTTAPPVAEAPVAGAGSTPTESDRALTVTALLFDRLSPEVRPLARRAAVTYAGTLAPPHDYAGVFLADLKLTTFAAFTADQERVRQGVERWAATAPSNLSPAADRSGASARTQTLPVDPSQAPTAGAESGSGWVNVLEREKYLAGSDPEAIMRRLEVRMAEGYQYFLNEHAGQASLAGLRATVSALAALPGRKSILYFAESLTITDRLKPKFEALIGEANRANITFYAVDSAGLRIHSQEAELGRNVAVAAAPGVDGAKREDGPWTRELERQDQLLSSGPRAALSRLTKETGGFLLENTNDLAAGVARMQQERTTYYLLAYQPSKAVPDGKFHRVQIKVKRSRVTVRARPGYLALSPQ